MEAIEYDFHVVTLQILANCVDCVMNCFIDEIHVDKHKNMQCSNGTEDSESFNAR